MMLFRKVKQSITNNVLGPAEDGRFQTIGFQRQTNDAEDSLDNLRHVQVFWSSSDFPKRGSGLQGPFKNEASYRIELSAAKEASIDLEVLNDDLATAEERATALASFQEAADLVDESFDELVDIIFQIIMDARNIDLGMPKGVVAERWLSQVKKDDPVPAGELAMLTGSMVLTCSVSEEAPGDPGVSGVKTMSTIVDIDGDDIEQTGVNVTN